MRDKHKNDGSSPETHASSFPLPRSAPAGRGAVAARLTVLFRAIPSETATNLFQSADDRFDAGIWEAQPGKWRVVFAENEFCHLLAV